MPRTLVLLRHGQSEWNLKNLFTGWKDPGLTPRGYDEAKAAGEALHGKGLHFDRAFVSDLTRAQETLKTALAALGQSGLETHVDAALHERSYGDLAGLNKDEARAKWGDAQVHLWRRSYETSPPGGESLRETVARVLPFYCQAILPCVLRGEDVLVAAHGNSLRALVMVLDGLDASTIPSVELLTGVPLVYELGPDSVVVSKEVLDPPIEAARRTGYCPKRREIGRHSRERQEGSPSASPRRAIMISSSNLPQSDRKTSCAFRPVS